MRNFVDYQTRVALRALSQKPDADLAMVYIEQPDGSKHQFLLIDPRQASNPTDPNSIGAGQDQAKVLRYQGYVQFAYQTASQAVQRILDAIGTNANGPTIVDLATALGLLTPAQNAFYNSLPEGLAKETFIANLINPGLAALGYNLLSPTADPLPNMHLVQGLYMATDVYGWTEFTIDPDTQQLDVKTHGITPYSQAELETSPSSVTSRSPQVVGEFTVTPTLAPAAHLVGSRLVINGSTGDDHIEVEQHDHGRIVVEVNEHKIGEFDAKAVDRIFIDGLAGNDFLKVASNVRISAILNGGSGDDELRGGGGGDILLGGAGADALFAGSGRDILIGGAGKDELHGQSGGAILIGGTTAYDKRTAVLQKILSEWDSDDAYLLRVAKIRSGLGVAALNDSTVFDDGVRDDLFGGGGLDWFFVGASDKLHGKSSAEQVS